MAKRRDRDDDDDIDYGSDKGGSRRRGLGGNSIDKNLLRPLVERIERLNEEKADLLEDIKQVYAEARDIGFDTKIIREAIKIRKMESDEREQRSALLDAYLRALGENVI